MKNLAALACASAVIAPLALLASPASAAPVLSDPFSVSQLTDDAETSGDEQGTETTTDQAETPPVGGDDDGDDDDADEDAEDESDDEEKPKVVPNRQPQVAWVKQVKVKGDSATVLVKYRCWGGEDGTMWVSLSQGGALAGKTEAQIDAIEDVAAVAAVVYDTDASKSSDDADCNGRWQVDKFKLASRQGTLRTGKTYVEFKLTDGLVAAPSRVEGDDLVKVKAYKVKAPKAKAPKKGKQAEHGKSGKSGKR